jgi:cell division protein FtsB
MEINQITQMIIEFAPVITALIGILVSLIIGIRRIKNSNEKTYGEIRKDNSNTINQLTDMNAQLVEANNKLRQENEALKSGLKEAIQELNDASHKIRSKKK